MAFFSGGNIDVVKLAELAVQELSMYAIAKQMGHSISGIRYCAERNNIVFTVCSKFKYINVDGVKMTTNDACESKGFKATSLYAWRVKRGLNEQDGFNAYVEYQKTKTTKKRQEGCLKGERTQSTYTQRKQKKKRRSGDGGFPSRLDDSHFQFFSFSIHGDQRI